jgi:hypothetical protein
VRSRIPIEPILQQSGMTWLKTIGEARKQAHAALDRQPALVSDLYDPSEGTPVFVPDTNALYHHPHLDDWRFRGASPFVLLLLSNVLAELDEAKVNHRNPDCRRRPRASLAASSPTARGATSSRESRSRRIRAP